MGNLNLFLGTTLKSLRYFTGMQPSLCQLSVISVCRPPATASCHGSYRRLTINRKMATEQEKSQGLSEEALKECCKEPDASTKDFIMQQTMYRIKDPKKSLKFYTEVLGMRLLQKFDFPQWTFSLYFMGYEDPKDIPEDRTERTRWMFTRRGCVELTHNWGTENDDSVQYHNGNSDPRGYGHIGIHVPDVGKACERFEKLGVKFIKKPDDGNMKGLAFIEDPDGYRVEILSSNQMAKDII